MLTANTKLNLVSVRGLDLITGNFPGPMGACCLVVLFGSFIYMLFRRPSNALSVMGYFAGVALIALVLPRVSGTLDSVLLEMAAGTTAFSALFLLNEPGTQPENFLSRLLFGLVGGALTVLMRIYGSYEDCTCFAILILDAFWPVVDKAFRRERRSSSRPAAQERAGV